MRYIIFLFSLSLFSKERILVLDFVRAENVHKEISSTAQNYFISELSKSGKYSIIEKDQLNEVLKEQELQKKGCTETICEIQIGQMLSANKVVSGNIIKSDTKYILTIQIRNVENQSIEFTETMNINDLDKLELSISSLVQKFVPTEEIKKNRIYTEEEIEKSARYSVFLPGAGQIYLKEYSTGIILLTPYIYTFYNIFVRIPQTKRDNFTLRDTEAIIRIGAYQYAVNTSNSIVNDTNSMIFIYLDIENNFKDQQNSIIRRKQTEASLTILGVMFFNLFDIVYRKKKNEQNFSFNIKPEHRTSDNNTYSSQSKLGTNFELYYTFRF